MLRQRHPRGDRGDGQTRGVFEADAGGQLGALVGAHDHFVGVRAALPTGKIGAANDARAEFEAARALAEFAHCSSEIDADNPRAAGTNDPLRQAERAALAHFPIHGIDANRRHAHPQFAAAQGHGRNREDLQGFRVAEG